MAGATSPAADTRVIASEAGRPVVHLPLAQLFQISLYWLGINAIWGGLNIALQEIVPPLAPQGEAGRALAILDIFAVIIAVAVQPTVGSISDYTISRWGRRKPYIAIGSVLDVVFLVGIATAQSYLSIFAFVLLLQFSSNFAQGPFQGYIPDLVPGPQVGLASALVGVMSILGVVGGALVISTGYVLHSFTLPIILVGLIELATAVGTVLWVREGRAPKDREGRSWPTVAREAWGMDVLREHSFIWLVGSRLFVLAGIAVLSKLAVFYLTRTMGLGDSEKAIWVPATLLLIGAITMTSTIPAAFLSDQIGRKTVIYGSTALGMAGAAVLAIAPSVWVAEVGVGLIAVAAGSFLSVDWALMTDIIPKASSGRYMGISNVATACAGPVALLTGGLLMDIAGGPEEAGSGPRAAMVVAVGLFALGAICLRPVRQGRVEDVSRAPVAGFPLRDAVVETEQAVL